MTKAILYIRIPKADSGLDVDVDRIPQHVYEAFLIRGAEHYLNRGIAKLGLIKGLKGSALRKAQAKAMEIAEANLKALYKGSI